MWNLAAAFCLLVFSAQTASAGWMAGANSIERGHDRSDRLAISVATAAALSQSLRL